MSIYGDVPDRLKSAAQSFIKKGETAEASKPVLYEGNMYYEIIYVSKMLWVKSRRINGRIIVDDMGNIIKDEPLLRNLIKLFYYYCTFFDTRIVDIGAMLKNDVQLKNEEESFNAAKSALEYLSSESAYGVKAAARVFDQFFKMRKEFNDVLKSMMDKIKGYDSKNAVFCYDILNDILPLYKKSSVMSFERVKLINTASQYYDDLRKVIIRKKRSVRYFTDAKLKNELNQLQNKLGFFINILKYYGSILNYSNERYDRYLAEVEEKSMDIRLKTMRY